MFFSACVNNYSYDIDTKVCFKVVLEKTTWKNARQHCQEDGGDLISIQSKEKWDLIIHNIKCKRSYTGNDSLAIQHLDRTELTKELRPSCKVVYTYYTLIYNL